MSTYHLIIISKNMHMKTHVTIKLFDYFIGEKEGKEKWREKPFWLNLVEATKTNFKSISLKYSQSHLIIIHQKYINTKWNSKFKRIFVTNKHNLRSSRWFDSVCFSLCLWVCKIISKSPPPKCCSLLSCWLRVSFSLLFSCKTKKKMRV